MKILRQSTTVTIMVGPAVDPTDGITPVTGMTTLARLSKAGGVYGARNSGTAIAHDENGFYTVPLNATDTDTLGELRVAFSDSATHVPFWVDFTVTPAAVYDALVAGTGNGVPSNVTTMAANVLTAAATAADFTTEIQTGLATSAALATVQADTDNIQTRLPTTLVSGRIDASVGAMAADVLTAAATAADFTTEVQTGLATAAALATVSTLLIAQDLVIGAGSSTTAVRTNATASNDDFNNLTLVVFRAAGPPVGRQIIDYANTNGQFTVSPALPFTPASGQRAVVIPIPFAILEASFAS